MTDKTAPVTPVIVTLIGIGDGSIQKDTTAKTPGTQPDLVVNVVGPIRAIVIRFANVFLVQLSGLLVAAMTPAGGRLLYTNDFLDLMLTCLSLSLPGAGLGLVKDLVTVFGKLEGKYPLLTGNV